MATGLSNKLTGQIGEYLACAELGRRGFIATSFTGNVPEFDLVVCDETLQTIPIQVKTSRSHTWPSQANLWMDIEIDQTTGRQTNRGPTPIKYPDLIFICIALGETSREDRFFICKKSDIQNACISAYSRWMSTKNWIRPHNPKSLDNRYEIQDLSQFENNWDLIGQRLNEKHNA